MVDAVDVGTDAVDDRGHDGRPVDQFVHGVQQRRRLADVDHRLDVVADQPTVRRTVVVRGQEHHLTAWVDGADRRIELVERSRTGTGVPRAACASRSIAC